MCRSYLSNARQRYQLPQPAYALKPGILQAASHRDGYRAQIMESELRLLRPRPPRRCYSSARVVIPLLSQRRAFLFAGSSSREATLSKYAVGRRHVLGGEMNAGAAHI